MTDIDPDDTSTASLINENLDIWFADLKTHITTQTDRIVQALDRVVAALNEDRK